MGKGRTLGNAEQISRFLEAKSDNTSMKRKFTESVVPQRFLKLVTAKETELSEKGKVKKTERFSIEK